MMEQLYKFTLLTRDHSSTAIVSARPKPAHARSRA